MTNDLVLLGIDPGNNTGVSIYYLDPVSLEINHIETFVIVLNNHINVSKDITLERNLLLSHICNKICTHYHPYVIGMETAFLNSRFPKAVMQLSQYVSTLEQCFYNYNHFIKIFKYPPKLIKKLIGGGGDANKDGMLQAVSNINEITNKLEITYLTEHEIDALAIGYITLSYIREYPHLLITY